MWFHIWGKSFSQCTLSSSLFSIIFAISYGLPIGNVNAQGYKPFSEQAEQQFRSELNQYREKKTVKNSNPNSIFGERIQQPLTTYDQEQINQVNRIEQTVRGSEFRDNPFAQREQNDPFEVNGGELRNMEVNTERRNRRTSNRRNNQNSSRQNQSNRNDRVINRDTIEDQEAIAELEGSRNNNQGQRRGTTIFEDDFLEAERDMEEGQNQGQLQDLTREARNINPRNQNQRQAANRNIRQAGQRGRQGQGQRNQQRQTAQNTFNQNEADNNDITGSIRNNELEDTYAAEGKRIGSFLLFPEISITGIYSDNPTASVQNGPGDSAIEILPSLNLQSDWARHSLQIQGQLRKSYYEELTSENIDEWLINANARIDIQNNHYIELQARREQTQDSRGDVDNLNSDAELANLNTMFLSTIYNYEWNRTTLRFTGALTDFDYEDVADGLGVITNNDDQDYLETNLTTRLAYTLHTGFYVYGEGNYVKREYDSSRDDDGFQRGSDGHTLRAGIIHDLTSKIRFEASIGYQSLFADDVRFTDVEDFVYEASLTYRPSRQTSLTFSTSKEYDATDIAGTIAVEETNYSIALNHYFRPHILINANLQHEEEAFEGVNLNQKTLTAGLTLQYIFNRHARIIAGYEFSDVSTSDGGDYQENQFRIGLNLRP